MDDDLCFTSAVELARLLHSRELSARELLDAFLNRIHRINPRLNAIVTLVAERASGQHGVFLLSQATGTRYSSSFSLPNTDSTKALTLLQANAPAHSGDTEQVVVASVERLALAASLTAAGSVLAANALAKVRVRVSSDSRFVAVYSATSHASLKRVA